MDKDTVEKLLGFADFPVDSGGSCPPKFTDRLAQQWHQAAQTRRVGLPYFRAISMANHGQFPSATIKPEEPFFLTLPGQMAKQSTPNRKYTIEFKADVLRLVAGLCQRERFG